MGLVLELLIKLPSTKLTNPYTPANRIAKTINDLILCIYGLLIGDENNTLKEFIAKLRAQKKPRMKHTRFLILFEIRINLIHWWSYISIQIRIRFFYLWLCFRSFWLFGFNILYKFTIDTLSKNYHIF